MNKRRFAITAAISFIILVVLMIVVIPAGLLLFKGDKKDNSEEALPNTGLDTSAVGGSLTNSIPPSPLELQGIPQDRLANLYRQLAPGVVNVQVPVKDTSSTGQPTFSGFIYDQEGHILTNLRAINGASQVTVIFSNGYSEDAKVIGEDIDTDLAVLKVDTVPEGAHSLSLGDSNQVEVGDWVVTLGNPYGMGCAMTIGIVNAAGASIPSKVLPFSFPQAIQNDSADRPGYNGGPLIDLDGKVIGINDQPAVQTGDSFAVPSNIAGRVVPSLIQKGSYVWPWLGIKGESLNRVLAQANQISIQEGVYIDQVDPAGSGTSAGLQGSSDKKVVNGQEVPVGGDVVVALDGKPVKNLSGFSAAIAAKNPGDPVILSVLRNGQQQEFHLKLIPRPEPVKP